jgi:hypothetical protein
MDAMVILCWLREAAFYRVVDSSCCNDLEAPGGFLGAGVRSSRSVPHPRGPIASLRLLGAFSR